ncbi:unnamed protein product, partial [Hapterophycus canaliculatus]
GANFARLLELERPSPDAPILQPRGTTALGVEGEGTLECGGDPGHFSARTYPDQRATLEGLLVRSEGDIEPWRLPAEGRLTGSVDFQPLPPCVANMCNVSGLKGILAAMDGCVGTRVEAFRLFVADLYFTTNQLQWLIEQLAGGPRPLNSAEMLEMMAAAVPQIYDNSGVPDLIDRNLSPMGRRMLVAQLGQAYPAFIGGVSGHFVLDLRFPTHRLAAVRLAEAENFQQRAASSWKAKRRQWALRGSRGRKGVRTQEVLRTVRLQTHLGFGVASGLCDKPTGVLELDFVCTTRPPEGTQPVSDLALARLLNNCGMLDPNYWLEYLRPSSFPVSFVDLIRLLRVKGRGDKRQAKLLVLLLRVKNSMFRATRLEKKRAEIPGWRQRNRRIGRALKAFQKPPTAVGNSTAAAVAKFVSASSSKPAGSYSTNTSTAARDVSAVTNNNETVPSGIEAIAAEVPPVDVATGIGGGSSVVASSPNHEVYPRSAASVSGARSTGATATAATDDSAVGKAQQLQQQEETEQQELTPIQAAVLAADQKLEGLLDVGRIIRGQSLEGNLVGFPRGMPVWGDSDGMTGSAETGNRGSRVGASECGGRVDAPDGAAAQGAGGGVMEWASRFCQTGAGFPPSNSEEGSRLRSALTKHVVQDGDVGLVGTSGRPTLLVHGLCICVRHRASDRVLRVKGNSASTGRSSGVEDTSLHQDRWAAVARQQVCGSRLRMGTRQEVASALATTFAGEGGKKDLASCSSATPRTLGTLNLTAHGGYRELFVPTELSAPTSLAEAGPLQLRLLVVNSSHEPDISRSLAQLRARLGGCWLSSAQAVTIASLVPRVLGG